jgi:hypothetical protein
LKEIQFSIRNKLEQCSSVKFAAQTICLGVVAAY